MRCFAMAIPASPAPLAISVSGPISRVDQSFADRAVPLLKEAGARISAEVQSGRWHCAPAPGQESPPAVPEVPALTSLRR